MVNLEKKLHKRLILKNSSTEIQITISNIITTL